MKRVNGLMLSTFEETAIIPSGLDSAHRPTQSLGLILRSISQEATPGAGPQPSRLVTTLLPFAFCAISSVT